MVLVLEILEMCKCDQVIGQASLTSKNDLGLVMYVCAMISGRSISPSAADTTKVAATAPVTWIYTERMWSAVHAERM
jgi:hypothetical protein